MNYTEDQIKEKYDSLPEDVRQAITSSEMEERIFEIARKNGVQIDESAELIRITGLVMLGLENKSDFVSMVQDALSVDFQKAQDIVVAINEQVFNSIRDSLKKIHNEDESTDGRESILQEIENPRFDRTGVNLLKKKSIEDFIKKPDITKERLSADVQTPKIEKKVDLDPYREAIE